MTEEEIYGTPPSLGRLLARIAQLKGALQEIVALRTHHYGDVPNGQLPSTDCEEADAFRLALAIAEKALK